MGDTHEQGYPTDKLTVDQVYAAARQAGFTGEDAITITAIAGPESGYDAHVLNDTPSTGDLSYGLTQINMLGGLGPDRRSGLGLTKLARKLGINTADTRAVNALLYDPAVNLQAAWEVSNHGQTFTPWSTYNHGSYVPYLPGARAAAARYEANGGPVSGSGSGSGSSSSQAGLHVPGLGAAAGALGGLAGDAAGAAKGLAGDAAGAAGSLGGDLWDATLGLPEKTAGLLIGLLGKVFDPLIDDVGNFAVKAGFATLGIGLVGAGLYQAFKPQIKAARAGAGQAATLAAAAA